MENLFVLIIYNIFCVRFMDQLFKEPLVFNHLSHCLSLSIHQTLSVNCVCVRVCDVCVLVTGRQYCVCV